jgi:hypothetical protein
VQVLRLRLVVLLAHRVVWALGLRLMVLGLVLGLRLLLARQAFFGLAAAGVALGSAARHRGAALDRRSHCFPEDVNERT